MNWEREKRKLCLFCAHFHVDEGSPGYSDYTPGTAFDMTCWKDHWEFDSYDCSESEYREMMLKAETCEDFVYYKDKEVAERLRV